MKMDLVNNLVFLYEAGGSNPQEYRIWTDQDLLYFDQLHQLRRERTKTGQEKFTGKIDGKDDDVIWATALALMENIEIQYGGFRVIESPYQDTNIRRRRTYGNMG